MNRYKLFASALCILSLNILFAQANAPQMSQQESPLTAIEYSDMNFSLEQNQHHTHFVVANNFTGKDAVIKSFSVHVDKKGIINIQDKQGNIVASFYAEPGDNDVQFLCFRGDYRLQESDIDRADPILTN